VKNLGVKIYYSFFVIGSLLAQNVPYATTSLPLNAYDTRNVLIPAGSTTQTVSFTVEADATGNSTFDIVNSEVGVNVSVTAPGGAVVTSANASSLGYSFNTYDAGAIDFSTAMPSALSMPGIHTLVQLPAGNASGAYTIQFDARALAVDSAAVVSYYPISTIRAGGITDSPTCRIGSTVVLSAFVYQADSPVNGATVSATVTPEISLSGQASVVNYTLVSQQSVPGNLSNYTYSASLSNSGPALNQITASIKTAPSSATVLTDTLAFSSMPANSTAPSSNTFTIQASASPSFDPTVLVWDISVPGIPAQVTLLDSGPFDNASGDGIYTGTFTSATVAPHSVAYSITGTSSSGVAFSRAAEAQFTVMQPLSSFLSFTDNLQNTGIATSISLNVQTAGSYRVSLSLQASNQKTVEETVSATLPAGTQTVQVPFTINDLLSLGVDGPYERINARLIYVANAETLADYRADAGPTPPFSLSSLNRGPVYFNGQASAAGINATDGHSGFATLEIQAGVALQQS